MDKINLAIDPKQRLQGHAPKPEQPTFDSVAVQAAQLKASDQEELIQILTEL